jgi:hypothetical protein
VRRPVSASLAALVLLGAAGCGRERLAVPEVERPDVTRPSAPRTFPKAGLRFAPPATWSADVGPAPLVLQMTSGNAAIAVWRYSRTEPLPTKGPQLEVAQAALLRAVKQRDEGYREITTRRTEVDGEPAIQLLGDQRIAGRDRRVRSTHVYAHGAEVVVDQYAAREDFARLDAAVFRPFVGTLRLSPPR